MALLSDIEPPSLQNEEEAIKKNLKNKNQIYKTIDLNLAKLRSFGAQIREIDHKQKLANFLVAIKSFFTTSKYFPHIAIVILALVIAAINFNQKVLADSINEQLVAINPDDQYAIASNVDQYTPLIPNAGKAVKNYVALASASSGFIATTGTVATDTTAVDSQNQTPVLPDNSSQTVNYTIQAGDTLSELGMQFGVKVASIKYVNNLSSTDLIQPGKTIKIPPKGWEASAAQIAAQTKSQQLATSKTTTAKSSSGKTSTVQAVKEINGVRYIRKANSNEMQCYTYVESQGYAIGGYGLAGLIPVNSKTPQVGGLVVTHESWAGHVAIVIAVHDDGTFDIRESNYTHGWITERTLSVNDGAIKGFVN